MGKSSKLKQFGLIIRAERIKRGLSQEALADLVGLDRSYVGGVERGERNLSFSNIMKFADGLGMSPSSLFKSL